MVCDGSLRDSPTGWPNAVRLGWAFDGLEQLDDFGRCNVLVIRCERPEGFYLVVLASDAARLCSIERPVAPA